MMKKALFLVFSIVVIFVMARPVFAMSITVSIPDKYATVKVGEKVFFETDIKWPENTGRKDLRVEYSIQDKDGKEVAYLKVLKAVETQASFMDSIVISEGTTPGLYKISTKVSDYGSLSEEATSSFNVIKGDIKSQTYISIIAVLALIIVLFVFSYILSWLRKRHHVKARSQKML